MKKSALFLLLFFMVFSPHVSFFSLTIKTAYFFVLLPAIIGLFWYYSRKIYSSHFFTILLLLELSFIYHLLAYVAHGFIDFSWIVRLFYGFIELFAALTIGVLYVRSYGSSAFYKILHHLFLIGVIHSILMIILFLNYDLREMFYSIVMITDLAYSSTFRDDGFSRFSGLLNTGFGSLSVLNASLILSGTFAYVFYGSIKLSFYIIGLLVIMIASMLSGRIGLVVSVLFLLIIILIPTKSREIRKRKAKFLFILIPLFLLLFTFLELYYPNVIHFAFEFYYNYRDYGELDRSTDLILNEEKISADFTVINSLFGYGNYQVPYDMGYRVMFMGGGYIGILISFMFLIQFLFIKKNEHFRVLKLDTLYLLFIIVFCIINIKNVYLFGYNDIFQIFFIVLCTAFFSPKNNLKLI